MAVQTRRMTVDEFWAQYAGQRFELINGEAVEMGTSGIWQSYIAARIVSFLMNFVTERQLGLVTTADGSYYLTPHDLRVPDAAFINNDKVARLQHPEGFAPFAPDLAVEVISPTNTAIEMREKVKLYLQSGTSLVWLVYPETREVIVHYADDTSKTFSIEDTLDGGDILPGFTLAVADIFPLKPTTEIEDTE